MTAWERIKYTLVRPDDEPSDRRVPLDDRTVDELEEAIKRSDDKERTIGLIAAPVAAIVGIAISSASISYARTHNQNVHVYEELTYVLLGLALLILISSLMRKRLFQGIALALFGVAVFQLKYTYVGFALPFVLFGAWYLVRTYRLQQALKRAGAEAGPTHQGPRLREAACPDPTSGTRLRRLSRCYGLSVYGLRVVVDQVRLEPAEPWRAADPHAGGAGSQRSSPAGSRSAGSGGRTPPDDACACPHDATGRRGPGRRARRRRPPWRRVR